MDISNVNSALSSLNQAQPATVSGAVSLKMLDNAMELSETMNEGLVRMMERSVNPHLGGNIDLFV